MNYYLGECPKFLMSDDDATALVGLFCLRFDIKKIPKIKYQPESTVLFGKFEYTLYGGKIFLYGTADLYTLLHELSHILQFTEYASAWEEINIHSYSFQAARKRTVRWWNGNYSNIHLIEKVTHV